MVSLGVKAIQARELERKYLVNLRSLITQIIKSNSQKTFKESIGRMLYSLIDLHEKSLFCKFVSATILEEIIVDVSDAGYEHIAEKNPINHLACSLASVISKPIGISRTNIHETFLVARVLIEMLRNHKVNHEDILNEIGVNFLQKFGIEIENLKEQKKGINAIMKQEEELQNDEELNEKEELEFEDDTNTTKENPVEEFKSLNDEKSINTEPEKFNVFDEGIDLL